MLSTPRKFKKSEKLRALWAVRLFLLPHMIAGPLIVGFALFLITVLVAGSTTSATITELKVVSDPEGPDRYVLHYDYDFQNRTYHGNASAGIYKDLKVGDRVSIKFLPLVPNLGTQILEGNAHWWTATFTLVFGVVWSSLMLVLCADPYIGAYRRTRIMKSGKMSSGRITDKVTIGEDKNLFALKFQFEPVPGQLLTAQREVSREQFDRAKIGELVTVLHDTAHPAESLIYRYSDYELVH
ncbi:MAG TPA: DUF3592 domain-containing protein [Drouetiella sp.]